MTATTMIFVIPCGSTDWSEQGRWQGRAALPLSEQGRQEVATVGEQLADKGIETLYCGGSPACRETAELVARRIGATVRRVRELEEVDLGHWQGLLDSQLRERHPKAYKQWLQQPTSVCPPAGELIDQACQRAAVVLGKILKRERNRTTGVVAPPLMAGLIRCHLEGISPENLWQLVRDQPHWSCYRLDAESVLKKL